jgi:RNA polymerase sigma factor (sigma-70 family)
LHRKTDFKNMSESKTRGSILLGVCQQDPERWRQFDAIYRPILSTFLHKRGVKDPEVEELIQEIYCKLLDKIRTYDSTRYRFRVWLFRVAKNALIDSIRRRTSYEKALKGWEQHMLEELQSTTVELEAEWEGIHRQKILKHALRAVRTQVKPHAWSCFVGRLLHDRPAQEIAHELGIKDPNTVYVHACRVLKKLREFCDEFGEDFSHGFESDL